MISRKRWDRFSLRRFAKFEDVKIDGQTADLEDSKLFSFVELDEFKSEHITAEPYSYWKSVMRTFLRKPSAIIAIVAMILLLLGVIIIPLITPIQYLNTNPYDIQGYGLFKTSVDPNVMDAPPLTGGHIWGTDHYGRDLFYMTWTAARTSMILALITSTLIVIIGTIVGLIWGFFRQLDPIFIEVYNLISNIPALLLYMLIAYIFQQAFPEVSASVKLVFALTITTWIALARFIRNQTIIITNREYNIASKTLGTPASRIMLKNLLPYLLSVIITQASLIIPSMISSEVALSFFGVGLPSNATSIGALLDSGRQNYDLYPWELLAPAGLLSFIIFSFFLFGVSLTDALDPKKHR